MDQKALDEQFIATLAGKYRSWGRIVSVLKKQFSVWMSDMLQENGYEDFKMAYMSLLMNIGPDGVTNKELSEKALITKQAMSKVVKELLEKGYIETEKDCGDKRCANIFLTTKGKRLSIVVREKNYELESLYQQKFGVAKMEEIKDILLEIMDFNNDTFFQK